MDIRQIRIGGFYVNEQKGQVREVYREKDGDVFWRSYNLSDGRPVGNWYVCSKDHMTRWANREANAEEVARMQRSEADQLMQAEEQRLTEKILRSLSDADILKEARRRGLIPP